MDEKISLEAIALYGDAYSEKKLDQFFTDKKMISGQEILSFSDVEQVNLFIIRDLFKNWREEIKKLKSPYFDYAHEDVKEALNDFMNIVSKHISVDRQHYAPLLKKSVSQTLLVIVNPYDYYSMILSGLNNKLDVAAFREEIKYLRINKAPLEILLEDLDKKSIREASGNEAFSMLDTILEKVNFTPENPDDYISKFNAVVKLNSSNFYIQKPAELEPITKQQPEISTLYDSLLQQPKPTLADNFRKIDRIKDRLTINQKFMFTKVLFRGDFESFSRAIEELDSFPDMNTALKYLDKFYSDWDKESEEFHEFLEMLDKRFS